MGTHRQTSLRTSRPTPSTPTRTFPFSRRLACNLIAAASFAIPSVSLGTTETAVTPAHGIAMHGEPAYAAGFEHFDYVNPDAPKGGTLRLGVVANGYDSFNPYVIGTVSAVGVGAYVYDTLLVKSSDEPFSAYGLIAESLETPEDRSYVVFNLREQARFQNGEPITAEDVKFSFELLTTEGHPLFRNYYGDVRAVTVEGPHRVRFDFKETENRELPLILGQLPVLPQHYWQDRTFGDNGLTPPVGSGPYRIGDFDAGRSITFTRVDDYWAANLGVRRGKFNFDRVHYDYYTDETVALEAFKSGDYDFRRESSAKSWATAYTGTPFEQGRIVVEELEHHKPMGMQAFVINSRRPQFADPRVRRALAMAFDFEWANTNLFYGQYTRTDSYFENSDLASSGLPDGRELEILEGYRDQLPDAVFESEYHPPTTNGPNGLRANLRKAVELFKEAGFEIRNRKMVHVATGEPLTFEFLLRSKTFERIALPFKANLAKLGIDAEVRLVDTTQYVQRVRRFDFDVVSLVIAQSDSPGNEQREFWGSYNVDVVGSRNYAGVSDPVVDDLVEQIIQAPDRQELVYRTRALDRVLLHGHYVIPQWHMTMDRVAYWSKLERPEALPKDGFDLDTWWIDPDAE
ncbi:extracellular solute-binding protein [Marinobacter xestospongiae]|uniref:extracellular solute-binding protein n=1 Tax=Marinobacter xestospongiae TaxID=994319 RepID=UPI0033741395